MRRDRLPQIVLALSAVAAVLLMEPGRMPAEQTDSAQPADRRPGTREVPNRSPTAVAVSPGGQYCLSVNHTADSVSLIDPERGRLLAEQPCGRGPVDALWVDRETVLVSLLRDDAVAVLRKEGNELEIAETISVGDEPRDLALPAAGGENGGRVFVALCGLDEVAEVDLASRAVVRRIPVGGAPRTLAVAPNGKWLVTCCSVPGEVFVHDVSNFELISRRNVFDYGFNLGPPVILPDSSAVVFASAINRTFPIHLDNIEKGWGIDNRLTRLPLPDGEYWQQKQLGLDVRGDAAGDAYAVALSPDETFLAVTCGGSHELLVLDREKLRWPSGNPGDFLPRDLQENGCFRRIELGGRPLGVEFLDDRHVVVANYLENAVQIVDVRAGEIVRTVDVGGPAEPSLARRGEAIFYDADRSFDSWFSCHTCHTDGHTSGQTFDTLNDGNFDTYKLVPSLRGVTGTPPWTWHGWQDSLSAAMHKSLDSTLSTQKPVTEEDVRALLAFLDTLEHPPSPHRREDGGLSESARRGKRLFEGKAGCMTCHRGPEFTSPETYTVGLESHRHAHPEFNPPSLRGLHSRRRFLHDGRAETLEEVLTRHHRPEDVAGQDLSDEELQDLIAYLKSL